MTDQWKKYKIIEKINSNSFADIYKAKNKDSNEFVAIKEINKLKIDSKIFLSQIEIINKLKSENFVKLLETFETKNSFCLVYELCYSNLELYLENRKCLSILEVKEILLELNNGFQEMYKKNIIHKDIKPSNILISLNKTKVNEICFKISDLGLNRILVKKETITSFSNKKSEIFSPEFLKEETNLISSKTDIWSLGILIYYLLNKEYPYSGTEYEIVNQIESKKNINPIEDKNLHDLILKMLNPNVNERISWKEYFEHPFFKDEKSLYNILCKEHSRNYYAYCSVCKCNICELCNHSSNSHNIIPFTELELNQNKISQTINNKKIIERINQLNEENEYLYNIIKENEKIYFDGLSEEENDLYSDNSIIIKENKSSLDLIKLNIAAKCCCRIEYIKSKEKFIGNGFLIQFFLKNSTNLIKGLMTTNNFINENIIKENIELFIYFNLGKQTIRLNMKNHFIFSDSFINITFIKLNNNDINNKDINFLIIDENKEEISDQIILIKNKFDGSLSFLEGKIISQWGFELYHSISSKYYGSALIERNTNKIISILTPKKSNTKYYPSINIKFIIKAINSIYINKDDIMVISKAKKLSKNEIKELNNKGLKNTQSDYIFESESSHFVTPLWFYRTNHNWYWTPVDPKINKKNALPSNWLIIYPKGSLKVIGGYWKGQEPAPINIDLIHWLESNGYKYLV